MRRPTVTVLTPTYNHERFIGPCIESVLAQTYPHWEMIVIDDGSTDGAPDAVRRYADPRIRYVRQQNKGVAGLGETYRSALALARGELVTILSGDDAWPPCKLEVQVPELEDEAVAACFGRGVMIDQDGREIGTVPRGRVNRVLNRPVGSLLRELLVHSFLPSFTYLVSRRALERIGGFVQPQGVLGVDSPTILHLALQGEFHFLDMPLGYWRVHRSQSTATHRLEQARSDAAYALGFFSSLPEELKRLTGWTERALARRLRRDVMNAHFEVGRRLLAAGRSDEALRWFGRAVWHGGLMTKMKGMVGSACAVLGVDLERVARIAGRPALR
ncbi:MAG: glycosyltransferase family 2 protein [Planctomycetes bacterium]|nr:glycosyltransferase family 2 protein [Planctomycetota bacterium]